MTNSTHGRFSWRRDPKRMKVDVKGMDSRHATKYLAQKHAKVQKRRRDIQEKEQRERFNREWDEEIKERKHPKKRGRAIMVGDESVDEFQEITKFRARKRARQPQGSKFDELKEKEFPGFEYMENIKDL
ncbi:hypothetical protein AAMO2058_001538800 [Amorphochlora amoebiformis]